MSLITGTAVGNVISSEEIYLEGSPQIYIADARGAYMKNPDSDGFYWMLSGTSTYPVYSIGCYDNVSFGDNLDINSVRCDVVGDKDVILRRNHMELKFTLKSFLPFTELSVLMNGGTVTTNASEHTQKFGFGDINNNVYYRVYLPKVYDDVAGDYVAITGHRCKIVSQGEIAFTYGNSWTLPITVWLMADESLPASQKFATVIRADRSVL